MHSALTLKFSRISRAKQKSNVHVQKTKKLKRKYDKRKINEIYELIWEQNQANDSNKSRMYKRILRSGQEFSRIKLCYKTAKENCKN